MTRVLAVPAAILTAFFALPSLAQHPELIPNSVKYSDSGLKPATGRAGDIAVEARALLGRDNVTDLELTTGSFEGEATPTGSLSHVQVKAALHLEEPVTKNYDAGGSFASIRLEGLTLVPREPIQVQANARSADGVRTGVVTFTETVKRRPDLRFLQASVPPNGIAGHPLNVYLHVGEMNGDLGARADCVLRVNGIEVDRAVNIWVDARSSVTCAMTHIFPTPGQHQVQLSIENVSPGDWNTANNGSSPIAVRIRDASEVVPGGSYAASARETTRISEYISRGDETAPEWENEISRLEDLVNVTRLDAAMPAELDFNTMKVSLSEDSDGTNLRYLVSRDYLEPDNWPRPGCADLAFGRSHSFFGCVGNGVTTFHYARGGSRTRYYSRWWGVFIDYWTGDRHTFDYDMSYTMTFGGNRFYGETVSMQLIAADADQIWQIDPFMTLQPWSEPDRVTQGCYQGWRGPVCWTWTQKSSGRDGADAKSW